MNKLDWYYKQTVTQGQMDWAFEQAEAAICQAAKFSYGEGIIEGGEVTQVTPAAEIAVMVAAFKLLDEEGRHVELSDAIKVLCSVDYDGISTYTDLVVGQGRWISVYAAFKRDLSEPKSDGNSVVVMSKLLDYYELFVVRGPAGYVNGGDLFEDEAFTIPLDRPTKPSEYTSSNDFRPDAILLADIKITEDAPIILTADIDYTYRGDWIREEGFANIAPEALIAGTPRDGLIAFATWLDEYLAGMLTVGFWEGIGANDGQLFADASALAVVGDVTVKAVVNKLIETYTAYTGAAKTGVAAYDAGGGITIANGTLQTALQRLATLIFNEATTRSGADGTLDTNKMDKSGGTFTGATHHTDIDFTGNINSINYANFYRNYSIAHMMFSQDHFYAPYGVTSNFIDSKDTAEACVYLPVPAYDNASRIYQGFIRTSVSISADGNRTIKVYLIRDDLLDGTQTVISGDALATITDAPDTAAHNTTFIIDASGLDLSEAGKEYAWHLAIMVTSTTGHYDYARIHGVNLRFGSKAIFG